MSAGHPMVRQRPLTMALVAVAAATALAAAIEVALVPDVGTGLPWLPYCVPLLGATYTAAGLEAWRRRPSNLVGPLLVVGGWIWLLSALPDTGNRLLEAASLLVGVLPVAIVIHVMLAFPSGRLGDPWAGAIVAGAYVALGVLEVPQYLFEPSPISVADDPDLDQLAEHLQRGLLWAVTAAAVVLLLVRGWRSRSSVRRVLVPVDVVGTLVIMAVVLAPVIETSVVAYDEERLATVQFALFALFPVVIVVGLLRGFARSGEVHELAARLGPGLDHVAVQAAVAEVLGDPTVEVRYWLPQRRAHVDHDGRAAPDPGPGRASVDVVLQGRLVGRLDYDAERVGEPDLVEGAADVLALAVDRESLTVELRASRDDLLESRARLMVAAEEERRRIARDLHDGLQSRLVLLAVQAQRLVDRTGGDPEAVQIRCGLESAIDEARGLVHGVMPALLIERGLLAATEELVDRLPLSARLEVSGSTDDLPAAVESAAFLIVNEALSNAVKHSGARGVNVRLARDDRELRIEVVDDGVGGVRAGAGRGLDGIEDRLVALGGRLELVSPHGGGTRISAVVPCGS